MHGQIQENPKGRVMNRSGDLHIPKIKNATDFGHLILVMPYFQVFYCFDIKRVSGPVVPLLGLWCPWRACGVPDRPVVPPGPKGGGS